MKTHAPTPDQKKKALKLCQEFEKLYPDFKTELTYDSPFQLLIAVILSAQCTDERVNKTTPELFKKFPTPETLSLAKPATVEKLIHSCGFYSQKTKSIIATAKKLLSDFHGKVPNTLEELVTLPGVGRKTASVILNQAFELPAIAVDTHVKRVSQRLGWAHSADPTKIELELKELLPENHWSAVNGRLIQHGRQVCHARKPKCENCPFTKDCDYYNSNLARNSTPSTFSKAPSRL